MPFNVKKKLQEKAKYYSRSKCSKYDSEEVPEIHFYVENINFLLRIQVNSSL